ncbi:hypothetical protein PMAYCL1PPCAC_17958 [Pristionchus mayeri]|uniref:Uncharacterized protein n=1 Tax=Pristionchus mayeri TaxID=1317129 RepID=A0AAN5CNM6_9BILA|nr:hypothetical protein PMAYCL1PPCAC_17958 [Pristionchus mayeri]
MDTNSSSDSTSEEEEDLVFFRGGPSSSRNGRCRGNGGKRGQRWKMEINELPLQVVHDTEYDVDYNRMVAWEAKSVKMTRDLRELERERANGGEIMDTVNEFIQRCLKEGRMREMDEKEAVRVTHVHEEELMEMKRKKRRSVAERLKVSEEKRRGWEEEN